MAPTNKRKIENRNHNNPAPEPTQQAATKAIKATKSTKAKKTKVAHTSSMPTNNYNRNTECSSCI